MKSICILIPVYNEEQVLPLLEKRLLSVCNPLPYRFRFLMVNDGSTDHTLSILKAMRQKDRRFSYLSLSRNYGKETAILAGMDYFDEDALILMDADLQDPPELIPHMLAQWENGYDDVYAQRTSREGESLLKRSTAFFYYRFLQKLSAIPIQKDTGDFRLLDRRCVYALRNLREQGRCSKSLFSWIGYAKKGIPFERPKRAAGKTKWNYKKLWNLAIDGITSLSVSPLKTASFLGISCLFFSVIALFTGIVFLSARESPYLAFGLTFFLFLFGIQFLLLGILGEYVGRILAEARHRPLYLADCYNERKVSNDNIIDNTNDKINDNIIDKISPSSDHSSDRHPAVLRRPF